MGFVVQKYSFIRSYTIAYNPSFYNWNNFSFSILNYNYLPSALDYLLKKQLSTFYFRLTTI